MEKNTQLNILGKKLTTLRERYEELKRDHDDLAADKEQAKLHRVALVKKENNQVLSQRELDAISNTKDNYPEFFDDSEESEPEFETTPEYKERVQVASIMEYLNEELSTSSSQLKEVAKE